MHGKSFGQSLSLRVDRHSGACLGEVFPVRPLRAGPRAALLRFPGRRRFRPAGATLRRGLALAAGPAASGDLVEQAGHGGLDLGQHGREPGVVVVRVEHAQLGSGLRVE